MSEKTNANNLARLVTRVVNHAQGKFTDLETGFDPNFMLSFSFTKSLRRGEEIQNATYTPILNHWGFDTLDYLMTGIGNSALPWLHEDTWKYLADLPDDFPVEKPLILTIEGPWTAVVEGIRAGQIMFKKTPGLIDLYTPRLEGGTRTGRDKILLKMRRPWQVEGPIHNLENCSLCERASKEQGKESQELKIIYNKYTPFEYHDLIIPKKEFYEAKKDDNYFLQSSNGLCEVLDLALGRFNELEQQRIILGTHQGYLAGQNQGHLHFHMVSPKGK